MENIGVTCDVCACCHNVDGCKCDLPQIKVTEQCSCTTQQVETPHYCQSYEEPAKPSAKAACTFSSLSSINTHSLAFS